MANTFIQFFHWYSPDDGTLWNELKEQAPHLQYLGINLAWLPPASKDYSGANGVGYAAYDLYDLGEFDQKATVRTKYGTKQEYLDAIQSLKAHGVKPVVDIIINHKMGADEQEKIFVQEVSPDDRNQYVGERVEKEVYSKFTFPGRQGKYSAFIWDFTCFTGVGDSEDFKKFYLVQNDYTVDGWDNVLSDELGSLDYLMGADVELRNPFVKEELFKWIEWYYKEVGFEGMRFDAVKHFSAEFMIEFINHIKVSDPNLYSLTDYWCYEVEELVAYLEHIQHSAKLYDAPLHRRFYEASISDNSFDMRTIFDGTLLQVQPDYAFTFVDTHDTQPLQALESPVEYWFKPIAYALILIRAHGDPCVFYPSLYGAKYRDFGKDGQEHDIDLVPVMGLEELLLLRKKYFDGMILDYFDHPNTIAWVKRNEALKYVYAAVLSNGGEGEKGVEFGQFFAGQKVYDLLQNRNEVITIDENGWAIIKCNERSISVWVLENMNIKE